VISAARRSRKSKHCERVVNITLCCTPTRRRAVCGHTVCRRGFIRTNDNRRVMIHRSEKNNFTRLTSILASGNRFPLFILARGNTERVARSQIGDRVRDWLSHSGTGSVTELTSEHDMEQLRTDDPGGHELYRLLDMTMCIGPLVSGQRLGNTSRPRQVRQFGRFLRSSCLSR
jgi:hypothetical protein